MRRVVRVRPSAAIVRLGVELTHVRLVVLFVLPEAESGTNLLCRGALVLGSGLGLTSLLLFAQEARSAKPPFHRYCFGQLL